MKTNYGPGRFSEAFRQRNTGDLGFLSYAWNEFFGYPWGDNSYMPTMPCRVKFKYFGGTWIIDGASKLIWVHSTGLELEYEAHWNYWRNDVRSMLHIMRNHPNLDNVRRELKLDGKLGDRPRIIGQGVSVEYIGRK